MRLLIVEDDYGSRKFMQKLLTDYGDCDVVVNGEEAIDAFKIAWEEKSPYDIIFMDIMMPKVDGHKALKEIRSIEETMKIRPFDAVKVIMTTVMEDPKNVIEAFHKGGADAYLVKPIEASKLRDELSKFGFTTMK